MAAARRWRWREKPLDWTVEVEGGWDLGLNWSGVVPEARVSFQILANCLESSGSARVGQTAVDPQPAHTRRGGRGVLGEGGEHRHRGRGGMEE